MPTKIYRYKLKDLINFIDTRSIAVPEFQRGYVWKKKQIGNLFDSLIKNYPVGSFIIWETNKNIDARTLNGEELPRQKYLILDGQQRLVSLYYLCKQKKFIRPQIKDKFHEVCDTRQKDLIDFELFYINRDNKELVLDYSREKFCEFDFKKFANLLGNYKFPLIIVSLNNYHKAIQIFERINQAGTRISTESIFLSETWNNHSNFSKILRKWRSENKESLARSIDTVIFIHIFALTFQLEKEIKKQKESNPEVGITTLKKIAEIIRNNESDKYNNKFEKVIKSTAKAITYLKEEFKIKKLTELPSQTMLTVLSVFFYYKEKSLNKLQKTELRKWFWRSSLSNRYIGSGYNQNIGDDAKKMKYLALNDAQLRLPKITLGFSRLENIDLRIGRSTFRNIIKQVLWQQNPVFIDGNAVSREDVESGQHKPEDDHFFPYDLYSKGLIGNEINNILNICFLNKDENVRKSKRLPSEWLQERIKQIKAMPKDVKKYLESQLLPFKDLNSIKRCEKNLKLKRKKKRKEEFLRCYWGFLWRRYKIFRKALDRLQDGKIK